MKIPSADPNPFAEFAELFTTAKREKWPAKKTAAALISTAENAPRTVTSSTPNHPPDALVGDQFSLQRVSFPRNPHLRFRGHRGGASRKKESNGNVDLQQKRAPSTSSALSAQQVSTQSDRWLQSHDEPSSGAHAAVILGRNFRSPVSS